MDGTYRGWAGGRRWNGVVGWVASQRRANTAIRVQTVVLCSQQMTGMYTNHRIDRDGHWQQFGTQPILISSCNALTRFYTVGKKPSVKAIYSQAVDVCGRCMSELLKLGHNLDFSSCDVIIGFHKSSHMCIMHMHTHIQTCYMCSTHTHACMQTYTHKFIHTYLHSISLTMSGDDIRAFSYSILILCCLICILCIHT